jgi:erythronate-4-phosphate dehydrogenase
LLKIADYGTPHIAGYSKDGKANGTKMSVQAISRFFSLGIDHWEPKMWNFPKIQLLKSMATSDGNIPFWQRLFLQHTKLKSTTKHFGKTRNCLKNWGDYPVRREFDSYTVVARNIENKTLEKLKKLGFSIKPQ